MKNGVQWADRALVTSPYHIGLCKSAAAFDAELKRLKVPKGERPAFVFTGAAATAHSFESSKGKLCAIVCIAEPDKGINRHQINALLVHEAMHVWRWIRENINEASPSAEFEAYSMQHISQALMEAYWAKPMKGNK